MTTAQTIYNELKQDGELGNITIEQIQGVIDFNETYQEPESGEWQVTVITAATKVEKPAFQLGQKVSWHYNANAWHSYAAYTTGTVKKVGTKLVTIEVKKANGEMVLRRVSPENLKVK